jgi:hypothetical protein
MASYNREFLIAQKHQKKRLKNFFTCPSILFLGEKNMKKSLIHFFTIENSLLDKKTEYTVKYRALNSSLLVFGFWKVDVFRPYKAI